MIFLHDCIVFFNKHIVNKIVAMLLNLILIWLLFLFCNLYFCAHPCRRYIPCPQRGTVNLYIICCIIIFRDLFGC